MRSNARTVAQRRLEILRIFQRSFNPEVSIYSLDGLYNGYTVAKYTRGKDLRDLKKQGLIEKVKGYRFHYRLTEKGKKLCRLTEKGKKLLQESDNG